MANKKIPGTSPDEFCKNQKANGKIQHFSDSTTGGLRLRITAAGKKVWIYGYSTKTAEGYINRSMTLGPFKDGKTAPADALTTKQARILAGELKAKIRHGADPATDKRRLIEDRITQEAARMSVKDVYDQWIESPSITKRKTYTEVIRMMQKDVLPIIGNLSITDVSKTHIMKIVGKLQTRGQRISRVVFDLISHLMTFAVNHGYSESNPCSNVSRAAVGSTGEERDRILCEDEVRELFERLPSSGLVSANVTAIVIQLSTCCRIGELLSAKWEDINFGRQEWYIPESKNGKSHIIYLGDFTVHHLNQLFDVTGHTPWLYPNRANSDHIDTKTITKQVRDRQRDNDDILKGRSIKHSQSLRLDSSRGERWTPHDLRRTGASLMAELGVLPDVIERCLNHTEQNRIKRTYQRYSYASEMRAAWELLGERLRQLSTPVLNET